MLIHLSRLQSFFFKYLSEVKKNSMEIISPAEIIKKSVREFIFSTKIDAVTCTYLNIFYFFVDFLLENLAPCTRNLKMLRKLDNLIKFDLFLTNKKHIFEKSTTKISYCSYCTPLAVTIDSCNFYVRNVDKH